MEVLRKELEEFNVEVKDERILSELLEVGERQGLRTVKLVEEWVSFSSNKKCNLDSYNIQRFNSQEWKCFLEKHLFSKQAMCCQLMSRQTKQHTPASRRSAPRTSDSSRMYTKESLHELFGGDIVGGITNEEDENIDLINTYGGTTPSTYGGTTPSRDPKGTKRSMTSPLTPVSKISHTPRAKQSPSTLLTEDQSPGSNHLSNTPLAKYSSRNNRGTIVCNFNPNIVIDQTTGSRSPKISLYGDTNLTYTPRHMFHKSLDRATVLLQRLEEFGKELCEINKLTDVYSLDQSTMDSSVYVGMVTCDGEGRLNPQSCLLEGVVSLGSRSSNCRVQLSLPDGLHSCCLFPGQMIAVEGQLHLDSNLLVASRIYDEGCFPPPPKRLYPHKNDVIGGFSMMVAAGPFSTSDSLGMAPLHDLLAQVSVEHPSVLLLMGPFVDSRHSEVQDWTQSMTFEYFMIKNILIPLAKTCHESRTRVIIVPSQRDVAHPWCVYPQPPFSLPKNIPSWISETVTFVSDPAIISVNGVCVGMSSTDILFHLSSLSMFIGPNPDRMTRLASHVLQQQSFYPLYPPYHRNDASSSDHTPYTDCATDINLDLLLAYDEGHALLPVRPDILIMTSDLKPFVKNIGGCVCLNTGHLTKKAGGGTYSRLIVEETISQDDISEHCGIHIAYI